MKYYYKLPVDSSTGVQLEKFFFSCLKAEQAADKYAASMGAVAYHSHPSAFAGGVAYLVFPKRFDEKTGKEETITDREQWRYVQTLNGEDCWEPNCQQRIGCLVFDDKRFMPSDTATRIYRKKLSTWAEVRNIHTTEQWKQLAGIKLKGTEEENRKALDTALQDKTFVVYTEFFGWQKPKKHGKPGIPQSLRRAIKAERMRMRLPVVPVERLYSLLHAQIIDADNNTDTCTPVFFKYNNYYYIGIDFLCKAEAMEEIPSQMFVCKKNIAAQEIKNK